MRVLMTSIRFRHLFVALATGLVVLAGAGMHSRLSAQSAAPSLPNGAPNGEWRTYGGDLSSTRYAALDQINRNNFSNLEIAWRFKTEAFGPRPEINFEGTPLMVGGVIYATVGTRRDVVAVDAATGEMLWSHREDEGARGAAAPRRLSGRGLAYWSDGRDSRILYVTPGYRLISLDAKTGNPVAQFGKAGIVDLKLDDDQTMDLITVAVDLMTGKRKWHYQLVHHGIWDMDIPDAPILLDITVNGKAIKAVAQPTKQGWLYVFDRVTGQPVWPIEEKPVAQGNVPGEWYSPTQPFPSKPAAYDRQGVLPDDLIDFTPELKAEGARVASRYKLGPIFTPPVTSTWPSPLATLMLPSSTCGANWPGGSFDPETKMLYIYSATQITPLGLVPGDTKKSEMRYVNGQATDPNAPAGGAAAGGGGGEGGPAINVQGLPLVKPPYGRITEFDMNKGDIGWQIAHGDTPDNIKNNPALKGLTIPRTGRIGRIGTLVTKSLVVAGEAGFATTPNGRGAMLRAYDKTNGNEVGAVYMPAPQTGSPMTYMLGGKQYIVLAISGAGFGSELIADKLP